MLKMFLLRTGKGEDYLKGRLTIPSVKFSCHTFERKDPRGCFPVNPTLHYALPSGEYPVKIAPYRFYPFTPHIIAPPYKRISLCEQTHSSVKAGCIAVGTAFEGTRLIGADDVLSALYELVRMHFDDWTSSGSLTIRYADNLAEENNSAIFEENNFNFLDL